jgi:hydroxymethylpyrimidine/phosphomethylpyrimidine kinase
LRGTGCLLACSLAAALARGASIPAAVERARAFVRECFTTSVAAGGMQIY